MSKKRKLNSKNPKYWDKSQVTGPEIKEKRFKNDEEKVITLTSKRKILTNKLKTKR